MLGLRELDRVLRGEATQPSQLVDASLAIRVVHLSFTIILLGLFYGLCMGCYSATRVFDLPCEDLLVIPLGQREFLMPWQVIATMVKVPLLFVATLLVTFPSLYVFNALVGSRLRVIDVLRLLIAALAVNLAVLASLGTIVAFFSISTTSYPFMVLLNVVVYGAAGLLGLTFLLQTLHRLSLSSPVPSQPDATPPDQKRPVEMGTDVSGEFVKDVEVVDKWAKQDGSPGQPGALDRLQGHVLGRHVKTIFRVWVVIFALVGAQMGWVLRPFVGSPSLPFSWFRERESNFFQAVMKSLEQLFFGS